MRIGPMSSFLLWWLSAAFALTGLWCIASARLTGSRDTRRVSLKAAWGFLAGSATLATLALLAA